MALMVLIVLVIALGFKHELIVQKDEKEQEENGREEERALEDFGHQ